MAQPGEVRRALLEKLWNGMDPFVGYKPVIGPDLQGWNSSHEYLAAAIDQHRPEIVVEVGVWKGASVITMARRMRDIGCNGVVIAVDTWLGSSEHWLNPDNRRMMPHMHGYPMLYFVFLGNIIAQGLQQYVLPVPLDSMSAGAVLQARGVRPSVIHVDAGHDYDAVTADLDRWWNLLQPGGTLVADDYDATRQVWGSVARAVDDFKARTRHLNFAAVPYKCRLTKPLV